jgi:hypothetical protein
MYWKLGARFLIALFAVSFAAGLLAMIAQRNKHLQTISFSYPAEMNNLSAEEINRRTLQLAATVATSEK